MKRYFDSVIKVLKLQAFVDWNKAAAEEVGKEVCDPAQEEEVQAEHACNESEKLALKKKGAPCPFAGFGVFGGGDVYDFLAQKQR